jgi:hypothetical protein
MAAFPAFFKNKLKQQVIFCSAVCCAGDNNEYCVSRKCRNSTGKE